MRFQAVVESIGTGPVRTVVKVPFDPVETWAKGSAARFPVRVKGTIRKAGKAAGGADGFPFRTSLSGKRNGTHWLVVNAKMQKGGQVTVGGLAEFVLEPDFSEDAATPPPELARFFKADRSMQKWYGKLGYSIRKYVAGSVAEPKSAQARARRAEQWMERLMFVMDGEVSPPPVLQMAFRRQPQARAGWDAMTESQRRLALLGISMCAGPEAQAKRVERALQDAVKAANRTKRARKPEE